MKIDNSELYRRFANNQSLEEVSYMGIIPPDSHSFELSQSYLDEVFNNHPQFSLIAIKEIDSTQFMVKINYHNETSIFLTSLRPIRKQQLQSLSVVNNLQEQDCIAIEEENFYVDVALMYGNDPFVYYLLQLKLMYSIVPNARLALDFSAQRLLPISWVKMLVDGDVAPSANHLYTIQSAYKRLQGQTVFWLYTKGLLRCNCIELEMVNIKQDADYMQYLLTDTANKLLLERQQEKQGFVLEYNDFEVHLVWQRWEEALSQLPESIPGGINNRNYHTMPSGILFAVEEDRFLSPQTYQPMLIQYPEFLLSPSRSLAQSKLAINQWNVFEHAFDLYGRPQEEDEEHLSFIARLFGKKKKKTSKILDPYLSQWSFLVKLGLNVPDDDDRKEHLWFKVLSIDDDQITAKLLYQFQIENDLNPGDVNTYSTDLLTDWLLYGLGAEYTPDVAYLLKQDIENETNNND